MIQDLIERVKDWDAKGKTPSLITATMNKLNAAQYANAIRNEGYNVQTTVKDGFYTLTITKKIL